MGVTSGVEASRTDPSEVLIVALSTLNRISLLKKVFKRNLRGTFFYILASR